MVNNIDNDYDKCQCRRFSLCCGENKYKNEAESAFFKLDPNNEVVQFNLKTLFDFTYRIATQRNPKVLAFIDKAFLQNSNHSIFIPQHSMKLDSTLMCVFLYGVYGQGAEQHLGKLLQDKKLSKKVMEILIWIGSQETLSLVNKAMLQNRDYETFVRALTFMMQNGGLQGKRIMLNVNPEIFDDRTQKYYSQIKPSIKKVTFEMMKKRFYGFPGQENLSENELKNRLAKMYENYGKDSETNPISLLNSELPKEYLISELENIRSRMFFRLSDEALSDVKLTNALINALKYRNM